MKESNKYLIKNVAVLTVGNFLTKILSFFLIPLYTAALTTAEYGIYDLINTTITLMIPILTLNVMEGIFRYALDKDVDKKDLIAIGIKYFIISTVITGVLAAANELTGLIPVFKDKAIFFFLMFTADALLGILTSIAKGFEKLQIIAVSGIVSCVVIISTNLLFLLVFKWGLPGYFISNILGVSLQCAYIVFGLKLWRYVKNPFRKNTERNVLEKSVVKYSKPLIAISIGWWVNNAASRYIVTAFCGVAVNGLFSVAYKIPSFLNVFASIFNQAWNLSAVIDFDKEDSDGFFAKTYSSYNCAMLFVCSGLIFGDKILAKMFFANDFYQAWIYVPLLVIAVFFGAISGYIGGIFAAVKKSDIYATSTIIGAVVNIILNFALVHSLDAVGSAIATVISYIVVWAIRYYELKKIMHIKINLKRDIFSYGILLVQAVCMMTISNPIYLYGSEAFCILLLAVLYRKEIVGCIELVLKKGKKA